jgi:uncharacterized membrane protein YdjX (TVP38/TMEM64 family)
VLVLATALTLVVSLVVTDAPIVRFVVRLYRDKSFLKTTVASWGSSAPLIFIAIQALQVIISPIPGEISGPVGGALFGTTLGVVYSTLGLTIGTLICFGLGRFYGEPFVRPWLSERSWKKMKFIVQAEGAILCFILYLIPGFPKDIVSYLFGISPIRFWVFAPVSTLGRLPGTWISSYVGAHVSEHEYITLFLMLALVAAVSVPLYYYRHRIVGFVTGLGERRKRVDSGVRGD